jgi:selenocysteine-specific elongation factor
VRLRGIRAHDHEAHEAVAGQRCALNIAGRGLDKDAVERGDWILNPALHAPVTRVDARLRLLGREPRALKSGTPVHIHLGAAETTGRVHILEDTSLAPGDEGLVQLALDRPLGALGRDRLVLRDKSARRTMAGGRVVDPFASARGRTKTARLERLAAMDWETPGEALAGLLDLATDGVNLDDFARAWNLEPAALDDLLTTQMAVVFALDAGRFAISDERWNGARQAIVARLERWHGQHPADLGAGDRDLASTVRSPTLRAAVLDALADDGQVVRRHGAYGLATHQPVMAAADSALWDDLQPLLREDPLRPPPIHALASALAMEVSALRRRMAGLARWGLVEQVADNRFFAADQARQLQVLAVDAANRAEDGQFSAGEFRDLSGIGRNLTIEVLEYFDRTGVTSRDGEGRRTIHSNFTLPEE